MKKLILPLLLCLFLTGCNNYNISRLNNNILKMFNDIDYVDSKLNKSEKQLIEKFREEQDPDNLVIELNTYFNELITSDLKI